MTLAKMALYGDKWLVFSGKKGEGGEKIIGRVDLSDFPLYVEKLWDHIRDCFISHPRKSSRDGRPKTEEGVIFAGTSISHYMHLFFFATKKFL